MKTLGMAEEHNKTADQIIGEQLEFFLRNRSGCAFAAVAARDAQHYEWQHEVIRAGEYAEIDGVIAQSVAAPEVSTLSILLPDITEPEELDLLLPELVGENLYLHEVFNTEHNACFRFRAKVGDEESYVSGFGPFEWMPSTRQTPHTALVMRVAPRPEYDWHLKEPDEGLVHVADMDMKGLSDRALEKMWRNSFIRTRGLLGKKPDEESAAKTTFVIPHARAEQISVQSAV